MEVSLDLSWVTLVATVVLPLLTGVVTKEMAPGGTKAVVLMALSAITAAVASIINLGGVFDLAEIVTATIVTFVGSVGVYFGFLKPTGAAAKVAGASFPEKGIGTDCDC